MIKKIFKRKEKNKSQKTTGHQWDGIKEYDNPDPSWLRVLFYGALIFAIVYWLFYPSWPTPNSVGVLDWSAEKQLEQELQEIEKMRSSYQEQFDKASFDDILKDKGLLKFALAGGYSAFQNNCAVCHGTNAQGNLGYPNLKDGEWIWGGSIDDIYTTLKYGIRSDHEETRESAMAAFGKEGILSKEQISSLAYYVMNLNNKKYNDPKAEALYQEQCSSCHGKNGEGSIEQGAPNLQDAIWLYSGDFASIYDVIYNGRAGVMPYWEGKLSDSTIRQLAIYVHQLSDKK